MTTTTSLCATCRQVPTKNTTLCSDCLDAVARDLGDVAALAADARRAFTTNPSRIKGTDDDPLVRSRMRRLVPKVDPARRACPVDPVTGGPVLVPEPLAAGEFGRDISTPWDADHGLGHEIDATIARQTATGQRNGSRATTTPLPFNETAAKVAVKVHKTLHGWIRQLHDGTERWPRDDVTAAAAWLLMHMRKVAVHPAADVLERDVRGAVEQLRRAVDRPADRWWMGPCNTDGCLEDHLLVDGEGNPRVVRRPTELTAEPDAKVIVCRSCGAEYDVDERRAWLLAAAEDVLATAEEIGRAAPALGIDTTPSAIRGMKHRGLIGERSVDRRGRPLYRVGDVIAVAAKAAAARGSRRSA